MHYYYITGTSRGIGKALSEELLLNPDNYVIGLSRTAGINHKNYQHISIDLSNVNSVEKFEFTNHINAASITLINNSGVIGDIKPVGLQNNNKIIETFAVNLVAPAILMNKFMAAFNKLTCDKTIINISSGAAANTIESWSSYCASKAGLDMFSRVAAAEQQTGKQGFKVYSVYPGIIDTQMQSEIRAANPQHFKDHQRFIELKEKNELLSPKQTAQKLLKLIASNSVSSTVFQLKDY